VAAVLSCRHLPFSLNLSIFHSQWRLLRSWYERIPRLVHFIKTDTDTAFSLLHYLSVRSAALGIQPTVVKFHCIVEPIGEYWTRLKQHVPELRVVRIPQLPLQLNGHPVHLAAHQSDIIRLQILIAEGGIYLDWDVLVLRNFNAFWTQGVVMGMEKPVASKDEALGVAVIMARPGEPFLTRWQRDMTDVYDPQCYVCHSVALARRLALTHPDEILVLDWTAFHAPGWEADAVALLFDERTSGAPPMVFTGWAMHLFESHNNVAVHVQALSGRWVVLNECV
jgi:hypothetical protein